jgi:transcriptional regulator with XRE-family HTH domain
MVLIIPRRRTSNGPAIRALRLARGYRSGEFAAAIGISSPYLANIEADRKHASAHVLERIAEALEVRIEAISVPGLPLPVTTV